MSDETKAQSITPNPHMFNPYIKYDDNVKFFTDVQKPLLQLEKRLKGMYIEEETGLWKSGGEPLMNLNGIRSLMTYLDSVINVTNIQANLSKQDFDKLCCESALTIIQMLKLNFNRWGMRRENLTPISEMCDIAVQLSLSRTISDKERGRWSKIITSSESINRVEMPKHKTFNLASQGPA